MKQPREFDKDGYHIEITGPAGRCQVWINGQPMIGLEYFKSLRAARNAAFGPHGYTKRHPLAQASDDHAAASAEASSSRPAGVNHAPRSHIP